MAYSCFSCGLAKTVENRLPAGWKRVRESIFCESCTKAQFVVRAVSVPVAAPVNLDWKSLDAALREQWRATTAASNWMVTELYARDVRRTTQDKMPPMRRVYFYPELRKKFPSLSAGTAAALERTVVKKYKAIRYRLIWTNEVSLPNFRYPTPLPIRAQNWRLSVAGRNPVVSFGLDGKNTVDLALKSGKSFHRQGAQLEQLASGEAIRAEASIYPKRRAGGGQMVMVKLIGWFPKPAERERSGLLQVRTDAADLLVVLNERNRVMWRYHADHAPRWAMEHKQRLRRWAEDSAIEGNAPPALEQRRGAALEKYRRRMHSLCHQAAACVADYAGRQRLAAVVYEDRTHEFAVSFPWATLESLLREKCEFYGVQFRKKTGQGGMEDSGGDARESAA